MPNNNNLLIRQSLELSLFSCDIFVIQVVLARNLNRTHTPGYIELLIQGFDCYHILTLRFNTTLVNTDAAALYVTFIRPLLLFLNHVLQCAATGAYRALQPARPRIRSTVPHRRRRPVPPPQYRAMGETRSPTRSSMEEHGATQ